MEQFSLEEIEWGVDRDRYNAFVQEVQTVAMAFGLEHRIEPTYFDDGRIDGNVQVYWCDWQDVAKETRAMTPDVERILYPAAWERIRAEAANELAKS